MSEPPTPEQDARVQAAAERVVSKIIVPPDLSMVGLLGSRDEVLKAVEQAVRSDVHVRGNEITVSGTATDNALAVLLVEQLIALLAKGEALTPDAVERAVAVLRQDARPAEVLTLNILSSRGRTIRPKTVNQKRYVEAIDRHTIVFGIGPAGTGKTYLAMAKAVQALQAKQVNRIILTRPAVEAGERLGFLPGTLNEKIDPYLRPLYDALHDMLDPESIPRLMAAGTIEVAPLAYMRGRAQPVDTAVLTPEGFRPLGSLQVGDLVVGADGCPTPVLGVYPQGRKEVFRVSTQDGASTLACGEHLWTVTTTDDRRRGRARRTLETREMAGSLRQDGAHRYELPVVQPVQLPARDVPLDPYALGLLLGDGCIPATTPASSTTDTEPLGHLTTGAADLDVGLGRQGAGGSAPPRDPGRGALRVADPVTVALVEPGLAGTRATTTSVPQAYLHNSVEVRLGVLQGLLDTGGGPVRQRGGTCRIRYTTVSERLRDDVVHLVRSLGGVACARTGRAQGRARGLASGPSAHRRSDVHVLDIRLPAGVAPFRRRRKQAAYEAEGGGTPRRYVHAIEPAGEAECVCIAVAAQDSLYVTEDFLVTHNTLNDAFIILDEAQNTTPEQMKMFLTRLGFGSKIVVTGDVTQVDLPGGSTSGLRVVRDILDGIDDVHFSTLSSSDVVRHKLVGRIVEAYAQFDAENETRGPQRTPGRRDDVRRR
jgi:phosphate starvation-inducible PhoH-like protein